MGVYPKFLKGGKIFVQPLELASFFRLEEHLERLAGQRLDLVIEARIAALLDQTAASSIRWLWRQ